MAIITGYTLAEFKRGKDKKKRKRRGALIAAGAAGTALTGYGASVGIRAGLNAKNSKSSTYLPDKKRMENGLEKFGRSVKGTLARDGARISKTTENAWNSAKRAGKAIKEGLTIGSGKGVGKNGHRTSAGILREPFNRVGNAVKGAWNSGKVGRAGLIGTGALAAGAAGLGAYKLATRNKKKRD